MPVYSMFYEDDGEPRCDLTVTCKTFPMDGSAAVDQTVTTVESAAVNSAVQIDVVAAAGTFTRASGSWITDGFAVGDGFHLKTGFVGNADVKKIASAVTALVLTTADISGLADETGSGDEVIQSLIPGLYVFTADLIGQVAAHWDAGVPLIGYNRYQPARYGHRVPERDEGLVTTPKIISVPWYKPRFHYRDTPGLSGSARPIATVQRIGDGLYYTGSAWQVGSATVTMTEVSGTNGVYEYILAFGDISDDTSRFQGSDGYRVTIVGDQGESHIIMYPVDAGYQVFTSQFRGLNIPTVPMVGDGLKVLFQRMQWSTASTGATPAVSIKRLSDDNEWKHSTGAWVASGSGDAGTMTGVTGSSGYYEYEIAEADLVRDAGAEGYLITVQDGPSGLEVEWCARYQPVSSWDDPRANHDVAGTYGPVVDDTSAATATAVWAVAPSSFTSGTVGRLLQLIGSLCHNNVRITPSLYDGNGNMTEGTMTAHGSAADALAGTGALQTFTITALYSGSQLTSYIVQGTT